MKWPLLLILALAAVGIIAWNRGDTTKGNKASRQPAGSSWNEAKATAYLAAHPSIAKDMWEASRPEPSMGYSGRPFKTVVAHALLESGLRPNAEGPEIKSGKNKGKKAYGYWQFVPATWREVMGDAPMTPANQVIAYKRSNGKLEREHGYSDPRSLIGSWHAGPNRSVWKLFEKGDPDSVKAAWSELGGITDGLSTTADYIYNILGSKEPKWRS